MLVFRLLRLPKRSIGSAREEKLYAGVGAMVVNGRDERGE